MRHRCVSIVAFTTVALAALPARAELVFFSTGRTMSVTAHRLDGDSLVLVLRGGGEMVCESSLIARFAPDEVPYPEPEIEAPAAPVRPVATAGPFSDIIDRVAAEQNVPAKLVVLLCTRRPLWARKNYSEGKGRPARSETPVPTGGHPRETGPRVGPALVGRVRAGDDFDPG